MGRLKNILLILLAVWLPIQASAAIAMSLCRHTTTAPATEEVTHCQAHMAQSAQSVAVVDLENDTACDNCALCHLASAGFLLGPNETFPLHSASILVPKLMTASASHIPEPPQQPPRR
jgi:hypothetical protein